MHYSRKLRAKGPRRRIQGRQLAVKFTRLRTGHILTRAYLFKIGQIASPLCPTCLVEETVEHLLIHCQKTPTIRLPLIRNLNSNKIPLTMEILLGNPQDINNVHQTEQRRLTLKYIKNLPIFPIP